MVNKLEILAVQYNIAPNDLKHHVYAFIVNALSPYPSATFGLYFDNEKINNKFKMHIMIPELDLRFRVDVMSYEKALYKALLFLQENRMISV